jgi:hypothetical protein
MDLSTHLGREEADMRKLIALIAACALFLGCVCAAAEGQTDAAQGDGPSGWRITNDINMDLDACRTLVWSIYPTDAAARKAMRSAVLLNAMEPALTITEDGVQLDVTLNGAQALSLGGQLTQDSVAIASTLLPSYVITVPTEKIMAIASSVASLFPSRKPTPKPDDDSGEALPPAGDTVPAEAQPDAGDDINPLIERISRFITEGGPEQGVFTVNGATFDLKRTYNVSPGGFVGIWDALVDWLFANEGVNTIIGIANNVGAKITAEQVKSLPPLDRLPRLTVTNYSHSLSGGSLVTATATSGDEKDVYGDGWIAFTGEAVTAWLQLPPWEVEADFALFQGDGVQLELNVRGKQPLCYATYSDVADAIRGNIRLPAWQSDASFELARTNGGLSGRLDTNYRKHYFGARFDAAPYDASGEGLVFNASVSVDDPSRLLFQEIFTLQPNSALTLDFTDANKTVLPIASLVTDEGKHIPAILTDLTINGLGELFVTTVKAVPELLQLLPGMP